MQFLLLPRLELLVRILMRQLGKLCFGSQELSSLLCEDNGPDTRQPVESAIKLYAFGLVPLLTSPSWVFLQVLREVGNVPLCSWRCRNQNHGSRRVAPRLVRGVAPRLVRRVVLRSSESRNLSCPKSWRRMVAHRRFEVLVVAHSLFLSPVVARFQLAR